MTTTDYLTELNIIVAAIGILFVVLTLYEFTSLRRLRNDFESFREQLAKEHYRHQQAAHRIIASYGIKDPSHRITVIKEALERDASVYNGYNALGYAYLEMNEKLKAADAFKAAIQYHPDDKAGYCDLAFAYLELGDQALCKEYLGKAIEIGPTAGDDIREDDRFKTLLL
jgi:Tfp pilus assembly protein PilF